MSAHLHRQERNAWAYPRMQICGSASSEDGLGRQEDHQVDGIDKLPQMLIALTIAYRGVKERRASLDATR
jgi:hypothetical protein